MVGGDGGAELEEVDVCDAAGAVRDVDEGGDGAGEFLAEVVTEADGEAEGWGEVAGEEDVLWGDEGELAATGGVADGGVAGGEVEGVWVWHGAAFLGDEAVVAGGGVVADF